MKITYNNKTYWLLRLGEPGKESNTALCLDEQGNKIKIELNINIVGSYAFPPKPEIKQ